jgi:two-component system, response regulator YesN
MSYNILLVDDDEIFREEFVSLFDDYSIIEASDGTQALDLLHKPNQIDLVILDVMIPGKKGTQILRDIKESYPELPVIILTGYSSNDIAISALKGRADDYIEKPINIEKTKEIISNFLLYKNKNGLDPDHSDIRGKVETIKIFIKRNYQKKISLEDAAGHVHLSPKYLSRIFKDITGFGFKEYILKIKVEEAKKLFIDTGFSIDEISFKLGYKNTESFSRIFKKESGFTPSEFKLSNQKS